MRQKRFLWAWAIALLPVSFGAHAEVYRCGNTYSHEPCEGGRTVDVTPPLSDPAGPGTKRIYLCRRPDNALFWVPDHCRGHGWTIERTETVPARVPWEQQLEIARAKRNAGEQLRQAAMVPPSVVQQYPDSGDAKASRCSYLDERIKDLDRMGRAGSRLYDLDWIRRERKSTRDEQFRLRC